MVANQLQPTLLSYVNNITSVLETEIGRTSDPASFSTEGAWCRESLDTSTRAGLARVLSGLWRLSLQQPVVAVILPSLHSEEMRLGEGQVRAGGGSLPWACPCYVATFVGGCPELRRLRSGLCPAFSGLAMKLEFSQVNDSE